MSRYYSNNYGSYVENFSDTKTIDKMSETEKKSYLNNLFDRITKKSVTKEELVVKVKELIDHKNKKETSEDIKNSINDIVVSAKKYIGGMKLQGNLELGGVMTSHGYYLSDGTKLKEVERVVNKMAVPLDKQGNIHLKTEGNKKINITGEVNFNDTRKGVTIHNGKHSSYNIHGRPTHFNHGGRGRNYISGRTDMNGEVLFNDTTKGVTILNAKDSNNNRHGHATHFNAGGRGYNYISGKTYMHGEVRLTDSTKGLYIPSTKNYWNKNGAQTYFNGGGINKLSGITYLNGTLYSSNKDSGIYIQNAKSGHNPNGRATSFNYGGSGVNEIGGTTTFTGPTITVNSHNVNVKSNNFNVNAHGRISTFGSLSSRWCHITTTAPQFYMNKGLQVNGYIRGYNDKPINADKGVIAPHIETNTLKVNKLEIGNWRIGIDNDKKLTFTNKDNNQRILALKPNGRIVVKKDGNNGSLSNFINWCDNNTDYKCN